MSIESEVNTVEWADIAAALETWTELEQHEVYQAATVVTQLLDGNIPARMDVK